MNQLNKKQKHKAWRKQFNSKVFDRDGGRCVLCSESAIDAHHITSHKLMPNGGYVIENGISLCDDCHFNAESFQKGKIVPECFHPNELYEKIGSSYEIAVEKSKLLE